ncbi:MAG TPA: PAS domain S-box protein, partial [Thermoanaerobaculia bacterium]|nr:PAS domain S-box protein [Thermoanaerobaculia bacterium]
MHPLELSPGSRARAGLGKSLSNQAELPVHETDHWFRILAESTSTAIFVYQADRVLYVNPACVELTGYTNEELLRMKPGDIAAPEFQDLLRERAAARLRGQPVPGRYEVRILTKDGRERWFDFTSAVIELEDGGPVALATAVDITDRKLGEERLRAIVEGTASTTGTDFLRSLVRHLAGALGMQYAFVSEVANEERTRVRLLALWEIDDYKPGFEYDLKGTPCEKVVGREICFFPSGVWKLFPEDRWIVETRIESYIAVPLFDRANRPLGH